MKHKVYIMDHRVDFFFFPRFPFGRLSVFFLSIFFFSLYPLRMHLIQIICSLLSIYMQHTHTHTPRLYNVPHVIHVISHRYVMKKEDNKKQSKKKKTKKKNEKGAYLCRSLPLFFFRQSMPISEEGGVSVSHVPNANVVL